MSLSFLQHIRLIIADVKTMLNLDPPLHPPSSIKVGSQHFFPTVQYHEKAIPFELTNTATFKETLAVNGDDCAHLRIKKVRYYERHIKPLHEFLVVDYGDQVQIEKGIQCTNYAVLERWSSDQKLDEDASKKSKKPEASGSASESNDVGSDRDTEDNAPRPRVGRTERGTTASLPGAETCLNDPVRNPSFSRLRGVFKASRNGSPEGTGGNKVANGENGGETRRESGLTRDPQCGDCAEIEPQLCLNKPNPDRLLDPLRNGLFVASGMSAESCSHATVANDRFLVSLNRNPADLDKLEPGGYTLLATLTPPAASTVSMAQLIVLASCVNNNIPGYEITTTQCYYYGRIMWDVLKMLMGAGAVDVRIKSPKMNIDVVDMILKQYKRYTAREVAKSFGAPAIEEKYNIDWAKFEKKLALNKAKIERPLREAEARAEKERRAKEEERRAKEEERRARVEADARAEEADARAEEERRAREEADARAEIERKEKEKLQLELEEMRRQMAGRAVSV